MDAAGRSLLMTICAGALLACGGGGGGDTAVVGAEGSQCYPNGTCDPGLTCLSTFCVRVTLDSGEKDAPGPDNGRGATDGGTTDAAPSILFTPAAHPPLPQVATLGGPVLQRPKVQPIVYASDTGASDIEAFLKDLTHIAYWNETTSEYGVGALNVLPAISIDSTAPPETSDDTLRSDLASNTSGANPIWGAADPSVIYLFVIPEDSTVNIGKSSCCSDFGGYHSEAPVGATTVPYAVGCSCPGFLGFTFTGLQTRTAAISHELVETATDPFPDSNPAFQLEDRADIVWTSITGGEVADMCAFNDDAYYVPPGSKYMVQRSWSDAAAKATQNPCVPHTTSAPYFNSFPALDSVALGDNGYITRGVTIPLGQSKTIDVTLFSAAPTSNTWAVSALDYDSWVRGTAPGLLLALDKSEGQNGDTLHLTITPKRIDPDLGMEAFVIISHSGGVRDPDYQTNMTMGFVTN